MDDPLVEVHYSEAGERDVPISLAIGVSRPKMGDGTLAPFSIYWAPKAEQWRKVRGRWVPFFEWAVGLEPDAEGIVGIYSRVFALGKKFEDNLVQQVNDFQDKVEKVQKEYRKQVEKANKESGDKRRLLLKFVEAQKDSAIIGAVNRFTSDMLRLQTDMVRSDIEEKHKGLAAKLVFWGKI